MYSNGNNRLHFIWFINNINFSVVLYVKKSILYNALINRQGMRVQSLSFGFLLTILLAFLYVMFSCVFVTFLCGFLGQVWYLIVLITDLCILPYFVQHFLLMSS